MAENGEELIRKGCHNRRNKRTGLALLFDPKCGYQQRKEMEELTARRKGEWLAQLTLKGLTFMHGEERRGGLR